MFHIMAFIYYLPNNLFATLVAKIEIFTMREPLGAMKIIWWGRVCYLEKLGKNGKKSIF